MKYVCLLAVISILPLFGACALINDAPRHTADEVTTIAKSFSPDCRLLLSAQTSHG
jgi:hypothetical protein